MALTVELTPTIARMIADPAHTKVVMGPRGELKTTGTYQYWLHLAAQVYAENPRLCPYRVCVIRDTWTHLRDSTIRTLKEMQSRGLAVQWRDDEHEAVAAGGLVQFLFRGMDHLRDLNQFQGMGLGGLWIEEPAPAAVNDIGAGLPIEVWAIGVTSLRQPGVPHRAVISMNPPDEEHWTLTLPAKIEELKHRPEFKTLNLSGALFPIPRGENPWITDEDRLAWQAALETAGRGDLVARLSTGQPGFVTQGEPVTPEYSDQRHVAPAPLAPLRRVDLIRAYDYGLTPVVVFSQVTPLGHWHLLDAVSGEGMGLEELLEIHALPWMRRYLGDLRDWRFRDIGGPEALVKEQFTSQTSALPSLQRILGGAISYEAGPVEWQARIQPLKRVLNRSIRGLPLVQVDPEARLIRRTLRGGAYYPKDSNGQVVRTVAAMKRVSGIFDDCLDALCHAAAILFPDYPPRPPRRETPAAPPSEHAWMGR